jgi:drug/metabolite transporter (DMT)-like permease
MATSLGSKCCEVCENISALSDSPAYRSLPTRGKSSTALTYFCTYSPGLRLFSNLIKRTPHTWSVILQDQSLPSSRPNWVAPSSTPHSRPVPQLASRRRCIVWFFGIAVLDGFSLYTTLLASHDISTPLRVILQQLTVPFSMAASFLFIRRRYHMVHVIAALAILVGITMCMANVLLHSVGQLSSPGWSLAYVSACASMALAGCLKEYLLVHPKFTLGIHVVNAWVALFQFLIGIAMVRDVRQIDPSCTLPRI